MVVVVKSSSPRTASSASRPGFIGASTYHVSSRSYTSHSVAKVTGGLVQVWISTSWVGRVVVMSWGAVVTWGEPIVVSVVVPPQAAMERMATTSKRLIVVIMRGFRQVPSVT